jgi:hypothetical protein
VIIILCRVHDIFRTMLPFTNAAYWTCASSLSLTRHPFPTSFPILSCSSGELKTYSRAEIRPGNFPWKFGLAFFSKFCFGPGRSVLSQLSVDVTSTRKTVSLLFWLCFVLGLHLQCVDAASGVIRGGFVFWFSLALHFIALHYMILHYLVLSYITLYH